MVGLVLGALAIAGGWRLATARHGAPGPVVVLARVLRWARLALGVHTLKDLMEQMCAEMLGGLLPSISKAYVPGVMTFGLHPRDAERWGAYGPQLADELRTTMLAEAAGRSDLHVGAGGVEVIVGTDEQARPGRPSFRAEMRRAGPSARRPPEQATQRAPIKPAWDERATVLLPEEPAAGGLALVMEGRPAMPLPEVMTIGRGDRATLKVGSIDVSREHARISRLDDSIAVVDLDSRNGTFVNDRRIQMATLRLGDTLRLGKTLTVTIARYAP